jgi:hypothetical protein
MKSGFSNDFSMVRSPNSVLTPLKSALNIRRNDVLDGLFALPTYSLGDHFVRKISYKHATQIAETKLPHVAPVVATATTQSPIGGVIAYKLS